MKILLVNKFYYHRGGDCTAVFSMEKLLKEKGHKVAIFSMNRPENAPSPWKKYFPKEVSFSFSSPASASSLFAAISGFFSAFVRIFHSPATARKFKRLLADFQPNVVHLHNIHSYLSPIVAQIAHQKGIRVVWTLHDYKLICPTYSCLRNGKNCEICFNNKSNVVWHKCMKNSYIASLLAYLEACWWNRKKLSRMTDTFISPSVFLKSKMEEAGFQSIQIEVLPNFMPDKLTCYPIKADYYCYVGRLSEEKGGNILLDAASQLPYSLKVIGEGHLSEKYREAYSHPQIEFCGYMPKEELYPIVQKARFIVIPSICYENNPFSVIEALCMGTPVLGAKIGGIPELIEEKKNGMLFLPGDVPDLINKICNCFEHLTDPEIFQQIATNAQNKFGSETFYIKLMNIYER